MALAKMTSVFRSRASEIQYSHQLIRISPFPSVTIRLRPKTIQYRQAANSIPLTAPLLVIVPHHSILDYYEPYNSSDLPRSTAYLLTLPLKFTNIRSTHPTPLAARMASTLRPSG